MIKTIRSDSSNADFQELVKALDNELKIRDGDEHGFYDQFNKITHIKYAVVAYENNEPLGCGAIKEHSNEMMEIKRMFVPFSKRGMGIASIILTELEKWAKELGNKKCILETGKRQPEAIALYGKNGYRVIPNYGQYTIMENSVCFEKELK